MKKFSRVAPPGFLTAVLIRRLDYTVIGNFRYFCSDCDAIEKENNRLQLENDELRLVNEVFVFVLLLV